MADRADEQGPVGQVAVRDLRGGKAHLQEAGTIVYGPQGRRTGLTVCQREMWNMVERVPLAQTAPEDRCRRCLPGGGDSRG